MAIRISLVNIHRSAQTSSYKTNKFQGYNVHHEEVTYFKSTLVKQ